MHSTVPTDSESPPLFVFPAPIEAPIYDADHMQRDLHPGPASPLLDRSTGLSGALTLLSRANALSGLQDAMHTPHEGAIVARYESQTNKVVAGAAENATKALEEAGWQFRFAAGYIALVHAGLSFVEDGDTTAVAAAHFKEFREQFGGTGPELVALRNGFAKQVKANTNKIVRRVPIKTKPRSHTNRAALQSVPLSDELIEQDGEGMDRAYFDPRPGSSVTIADHNRLIINSLHLLGAANVATEQGDDSLNKQWKPNRPAGTTDELRAKASSQLEQAMGYVVLENAGMMTPKLRLAHDKDTKSFFQQYGVMGQARVRSDYEKILYRNSNPDMVARMRRRILPETRDDELSTRLKVQMLHGDPRVRFMPASHDEKSDAGDVMNYIEGGEQPGGIHQYLMTIYDNQIRKGARKGLNPHERKHVAQDAIRSALYEFGDYAANAIASAAMLGKISDLIDHSANPRQSLADLINANEAQHLDAGPLIRYMDILAFREYNRQPGFDILKNKPNRNLASGARNKTLEDHYTSRQRSKEMDEYIRGTCPRLTNRGTP